MLICVYEEGVGGRPGSSASSEDDDGDFVKRIINTKTT